MISENEKSRIDRRHFFYVRGIEQIVPSGTMPLDFQFWRANIDPTERYVLSSKGSIKHRLKSGEPSFGNLYLARDWTDNGLNIGCVEAAATSGIQAARAILGGAQGCGRHSKGRQNRIQCSKSRY